MEVVWLIWVASWHLLPWSLVLPSLSFLLTRESLTPRHQRCQFWVEGMSSSTLIDNDRNHVADSFILPSSYILPPSRKQVRNMTDHCLIPSLWAPLSTAGNVNNMYYVYSRRHYIVREVTERGPWWLLSTTDYSNKLRLGRSGVRVLKPNWTHSCHNFELTVREEADGNNYISRTPFFKAAYRYIGDDAFVNETIIWFKVEGQTKR